MSKVSDCPFCERDIAWQHAADCPNHPDNRERPDAAPPKDEFADGSVPFYDVHPPADAAQPEAPPKDHTVRSFSCGCCWWVASIPCSVEHGKNGPLNRAHPEDGDDDQ